MAEPREEPELEQPEETPGALAETEQAEVVDAEVVDEPGSPEPVDPLDQLLKQHTGAGTQSRADPVVSVVLMTITESGKVAAIDQRSRVE